MDISSKSVIIWGFIEGAGKIIDHLIAERAIQPKMWITENGSGEPLRYPFQREFDHYVTENWIDIYIGDYLENALKLPRDIREHMAAFLPDYIDFNTRPWREFQQKEYSSFRHNYFLLCEMFYGLIKKNNIYAVLFGNIPHEGADLILYVMAKRLNIQTCILSQCVHLSNLLVYFWDMEEYGEFLRFYRRHNFRISKKKSNEMYWINEKADLGEEEILKNMNGSDYIRALSVLKLLRRRSYLYHRKTLTAANVSLAEKYVYFPLHAQPEMATHPLGGVYGDQLYALECLSELLPSDWLIYVKEHPCQTEYMRPDIFFKRFATIPKLRLVDIELDSAELIKNSQFVSTITGTAGWEALNMGKKTLLFGRYWYQRLPGVFKYSPQLKIDEIIEYSFSKEQMTSVLHEIEKRMWPGVISPVYDKDICVSENNILSVSALLKKMLYEKPEEKQL